MNYQQYLKKQQERVNALPLFWAFSEVQFREAMSERGLNAENQEDRNQVIRIKSMGGALCLKKDIPVIEAFMDEPDELQDLLRDPEFAREAFLYEMQNHEYAINWTADYDVLSCFGPLTFAEENGAREYMDQLQFTDEQRRAYWLARRDYDKIRRDNGWD